MRLLIAQCTIVVAASLNAQPGTVDLSFDPGVSVALNLDETEAALIFAVAVQPEDGKILIGGRFSYYQGVPRPILVRTFPNGVIDVSYVPPFSAGPWFAYNVDAIAVDHEGGCIVSGYIDIDGNGFGLRTLLRLRADGTLDTTFLLNTGTGPDSPPNSIAIRDNGNIIIGGNFMQFNGHARPGIAELDALGNLVTTQTFAATFSLSDTCLGWLLNLDKVCAGPDGSIVVCGKFSHYGSLEVPGLAMFDSTGVIVSSHVLDVQNGVDECGRVMNVVIESSGTMVIAGDFIEVNGVPVASMARLLADGSVDTSFNFAPSSIGSAYGPQGGIILSDGAGGYLVGCPDDQGGVFANLDSTGAPYPNFLNMACATGTMQLTVTGNILVAGGFSTCGGVPRNSLAQIHGRNGPALWQCLNTQAQVLSGNDSLIFSGDSTGWHKLLVEQCMQLTVRKCSESGVEQFSDGLYFSCPAYVDSIIPLSTALPNSCGGQDRVIQDLPSGTYWLAVQASNGPYSFTVHNTLCGPVDCQGTPGGTALSGTPCDDGNTGTIDDTWGTDCICQGQPDPNLDCTGTPGGAAVPGTPCDDGIFFTTADSWTADCICAGFDCQGVQGGGALPGTPCDDLDPATLVDVWTVDCTCGTLTGINETSPTPLIMLRPNPCSQESFELIFSSTGSKPIELRLLDTAMRDVRSEVVRPQGNATYNMDRSSVPPGLYFLEVQHQHGRSLHRLILQ